MYYRQQNVFVSEPKFSVTTVMVFPVEGVQFESDSSWEKFQSPTPLSTIPQEIGLEHNWQRCVDFATPAASITPSVATIWIATHKEKRHAFLSTSSSLHITNDEHQ